jgi:hypothetical protein
MSTGILREHNVHKKAVDYMALSGDRIVTGSGGVIRLFNASSGLLVLCSCFYK